MSRRLTAVWLLLCLLTLMTGCGARVGADDLQRTREGIQEMVAETEAGRIRDGEKAFNRVHDFFHAVDPALRRADPELAQSLWDTILRIEFEYAGRRNPDVLIREGRLTLKLLPQAGRALGWE